MLPQMQIRDRGQSRLDSWSSNIRSKLYESLWKLILFPLILIHFNVELVQQTCNQSMSSQLGIKHYLTEVPKP